MPACSSLHAASRDQACYIVAVSDVTLLPALAMQSRMLRLLNDVLDIGKFCPLQNDNSLCCTPSKPYQPLPLLTKACSLLLLCQRLMHQLWLSSGKMLTSSQ